MNNVAKQLTWLQKKIADSNEADTPIREVQRLNNFQTEDVFNLEFYGDCFDETYNLLLRTLANPQIAPCIRSLSLRGPDEGSNGTKNWDLAPLLSTDAKFSRLETFSIELNQATDHNRAIVGSEFEEDGLLALLLTKAPKLQALTVPSAPDVAFFNVGQRPLRFLSIDAGYDTQRFIENLARSSCFPNLQSLEWGEYNETYMDDYLERCTSLEAYHYLFKSDAFRQITRFVWRNPVCSNEEIQELKKTNPNQQVVVIHSSKEYL